MSEKVLMWSFFVLIFITAFAVLHEVMKSVPIVYHILLGIGLLSGIIAFFSLLVCLTPTGANK